MITPGETGVAVSVRDAESKVIVAMLAKEAGVIGIGVEITKTLLADQVMLGKGLGKDKGESEVRSTKEVETAAWPTKRWMSALTGCSMNSLKGFPLFCQTCTFSDR